MTDNRTTEHLRALLDKRGVEWKSGRTNENNTSWDVGDLRVTAKELSDGTLLIQQYSRKHFTPEQAIAATLGSGTCEMVLMWSDYEDGECYKCSKCSDFAFTRGGEPRFCPNCGAKVVKQ